MNSNSMALVVASLIPRRGLAGRSLGWLVAAVAMSLMVAAPAHAAFGLSRVGGSTLDQVGGPFTQAGGHPYEQVTEIEFNTHHDPVWDMEEPDSLVRDLTVDLPAGFIGNPAATPVRCTEPQLAADECPVSSEVGILHLAGGTLNFYAGLYNMVPPSGTPAEFAFRVKVFHLNVHIQARVRSNGDYGVSVDTRDISEGLPIAKIVIKLWGIPADPSHDSVRGSCLSELGVSTGVCATDAAPKPFLTNPTDCSAGALATFVRADPWDDAGVFATASFDHDLNGYPLAATGCEAVPFDPTIQVQPTEHAPAAPTGLNVKLSIPTEGLESRTGVAQAELRKAVIRLPEGMAVNPSAADGLSACSPSQIALGSVQGATCPDSSKVGSVQIDTPLLSQPLVGSVYLAKQGENPFGSLLAMYLVAEGQGVVLKLPGKIDADPNTGQLTATFDNTPQLPFSSLSLTLKGGPRAPLVTPASCGDKAITAELTGWNGKTVVSSSSYGVDCAVGLGGFAPGFVAGTTNPQAGGFSPFALTLTRPDGDQTLGGISLQMPPGLLGVLKSVALCADAQAAAGGCGGESLIGHTTVGAGAGSDPFYLGGQVFLTGPYKGAPFGLSIVVPAIAGPFNLGTVVVRASVAVDPHTAQLTITSDPLPTILQGIPLDLRVVNVIVDRSGFIFNPTNCEALSVGGKISSAQGASVVVSSHFQAAGCASLPFAPRFSASSLGKASRLRGAALDVKVAYPSGAQANIHSVRVTLPKQLPSRLSTIKLACPAATFEANPASCGEGSLVGMVTASTPILAAPLTGPAYLVSHGGDSFPDIVLVLQSEGIRVDLVGNIAIKSGVTSTTFAHVPDAPISGFELSLPQGTHSALAAVGSLCARALTMPTTITAQNGAVVKQATKIKVSGCRKAKKKAKKAKQRKHRQARKGSLRSER